MDTIEKIFNEAIDELNAQLDDDKQISNTENITLIGSDSLIDSMEFVAFIAIIEDIIFEYYNKKISIVSDKAFSSSNSPFRSIKTLKNYVLELIKETNE